MTSFLSRECDDADLQFGRERKGHKIRLREGGGIDRFTHARGAESPTDRSANFGLGQTRQIRKKVRTRSNETETFK